MATSRNLLALAASALALGGLAGCAGARPASGAGEPLELVSAEGLAVPLETLRAGKDATVLVFWSGECPCVRRYQERVDALLETWPAERVRVLGVASNAGEPLEDVVRVARERGVRVPVYRDPGGRVAEAVGARSTPTVVVLDREGRTRFSGWLDNERLPGEPGREPWLDRALAGLLESRPFQAKTPTWGCTITRSLFEKPSGSPCCTVPH